MNEAYVAETALIVEAIGRVREHFYFNNSRPLAPFRPFADAGAMPIREMAFWETVGDHAQALANEVNAFRHRVGQLAAWAVELPRHAQEDQLGLLIELIDPIAASAASAPYALRSRFIYCASYSSHLANLLVMSNWRESSLPRDASIDHKVMVRVSERWRSFRAFKQKLSTLNDAAFDTVMRGYRNKTQHQNPPRFHLGHTQFVTRRQEGAHVVYGFGHTEPIALADAVSALDVQHARALDTFHAFVDMVKEQIAAIEARRAPQ